MHASTYSAILIYNGGGRQGEALQPLHRHVQAVSSREVLDDDEAGLGGAEQPR